jgi:hypothetical protein
MSEQIDNKETETKPELYTVLATVVSMVKEEVAEEYGFKKAFIVDTKWDYAMMIHHRTKKQIEMYERLCMKLAHYCC